MKPNQVQEHLYLLARTQVIADPAVAKCWCFVVDALRFDMFGMSDLPDLVAAMRRRDERDYQEIDFEWDYDDEDQSTLVLTFIKDEYRCSTEGMIAELERLMRRFRGEPDPGPGGSPPDESDREPSGAGGSRAHETTGDDVLDLLCAALGSSDQILADGDADALRARFAALTREVREIARDLSHGTMATRKKAQERAAALRQRLLDEGVIAGDVGATGGHVAARLPRAIVHREIDTGGLRNALQVLAGWLNGQGQEAGQTIDGLIERLERALDGVIGPSRAEQDAETEVRMRGRARSSIATRMKGVGFAAMSDAKHDGQDDATSDARNAEEPDA